jgi:glycerophosphoryl diester phosphodiesterase
MPALFDLQGHRGARGLKPENTLPSFETALDLGVTSIETDVRLTCDGTPLLIHDAVVSERLCRHLPGAAALDPAERPLVATLTLAQMRTYRADCNPDPGRFPGQDASITPLAEIVASKRNVDPYTPPALSDLFDLVEAYTGELGVQAGKTSEQRARASRVRFDLELKRRPFRPETIGDCFDGTSASVLEKRILETVQTEGVIERTVVRSFDHRSLLALRRLEPSLATAVLVADTAPVCPALLAQQAGASTYCPNAEFLDEAQVRQIHAEGIRVVPWTVNEPGDWARLLAWGVDGITTDYPDRLAAYLNERGIPF